MRLGGRGSERFALPPGTHRRPSAKRSGCLEHGSTSGRTAGTSPTAGTLSRSSRRAGSHCRKALLLSRFSRICVVPSFDESESSPRRWRSYSTSSANFRSQTTDRSCQGGQRRLEPDELVVHVDALGCQYGGDEMPRHAIPSFFVNPFWSGSRQGEVGVPDPESSRLTSGVSTGETRFVNKT